VVGARACLPSSRRARSKVGESAPVVSVLTSTQGHRVTTAALGVGIVVVACLSRLAPSRDGAHGAVARRRAAKAHWPSRPALATLWHPYWHPEVGDDEGLILSVTRLRGLASGYTPSDTLPDTSKNPTLDTFKIHQDTSGYVSDNNNPPAPMCPDPY
jgi:hypothetical protein